MPEGAEVIPLRIKEQAPDITRFERFAVPNRPLTAREKEIYRKLADDWARLDAIAQTMLYTALLQGKLTRQLQELFSETLCETSETLRRHDDPDTLPLLKTFTETMRQQDMPILLGLKLTAAKKMEAIMAEDSPSARPQGFWQRWRAGPDG